jgi:putative spermidine/putrescine transport system substrate-binding protein
MNHNAFTRRSLLAGGAAMTVASLMPRGASGTTRFVFGTYGGPYEEILRKDGIIDAFARANDAEVKLELGLGTTFLQKLIASRGRPPYDVIIVNEDEALVGTDAKLFAPIDTKRLSNAGQIHELLMPPHVEMYGTMLFELTCVYNTKTMTEPKSWADLWRKGVKIGVASPQNSYGLLFLKVAAELAGADENNLAAGFPMLKKLDQIKLYRGVVEGLQLFRTGEVDAALFYRNRAIQLADEGHPIGFVAPKEGSFGIRSGQQIPKGVPNMDLSLKWINLALGADYQRAFAEALYSPSNLTVKLPPELAKKHVYGKEAISALRFANWKTINAQKSAIYERWDKEFVI